MVNGRPVKTTASIDPTASGWFYRLAPGLMLCNRKQENDAFSSEKVLWVKSGRAFPLGHPTTRLCLDLLAGAVAERPGQTVLEVGCGSGVLCLAAAALGVPQVTGLDISGRAVQVTRKNARVNGLAGAINVAQGSTDCLQASFDLVVANLPWEVQMDKVPELHRLAGAEGRLILSGFRDNQEEQLLASYQGLGWTLSRRLVKYFTHPELPPYISFNWVAWLLAHPSY